MNREIVWTPTRWPGCEHLHVRSEGTEVTAHGMIIAVLDKTPLRVSYEITCDDAWRTRRLAIGLHRGPTTTLTRHDDGRWHESDGTVRADLAGCIDVDIALTPFTNTLPIRRLQLKPGESADLRAVYIQFEPTLTVATSDQRYTRLATEAGAIYRYQSGTFTADLEVDTDGIVTEYPGLWDRALAPDADGRDAAGEFSGD
ncbi:putative glycolipid-binding domain-containing protein [Phytoactinopolyspora endophytica]|uniref:putative glycolipid-binding domain-containing protein n=1 Tax=Phytoactinopolyspora endophytica TaxID=1642495 RepID=UPI00101DD379|nr:putative glycolipid-binding domain-containing protein [Phytoactinopolyspora endophytica]